MAIPLIVLAIGSILAGYVGVPHALGGTNRIERFLEPSFEVSESARDGIHDGRGCRAARGRGRGGAGRAAGTGAARRRSTAHRPS